MKSIWVCGSPGLRLNARASLLSAVDLWANCLTSLSLSFYKVGLASPTSEGCYGICPETTHIPRPPSICLIENL